MKNPWDEETSESYRNVTPETIQKEANQEKGKMRQKDISWEHKVIEKTLLSSITEMRRARRWGIFFKSITLLYVLGFLWLIYTPGFSDSAPASQSPHLALIELDGVIASQRPANADSLSKTLTQAFESPMSKAIVIKINSPGGSPVQSNQIYQTIQSLRETHPDKKVYAVIEDVGASGAYFVAAAADEIYADPTSLVGSIGVIYSGFGLTELIEKIGVERRVYTSGIYKDSLDAFKKTNEKEVEHLQVILDSVHQTFVDAVVEGRGDRLSNDPLIFSGRYWDGKQALELGLVDDLMSVNYLAENVLNLEVVKYLPKQNLFDQFAERLTNTMANFMAGTMSNIMQESSAIDVGWQAVAQ